MTVLASRNKKPLMFFNINGLSGFLMVGVVELESTTFTMST